MIVALWACGGLEPEKSRVGPDPTIPGDDVPVEGEPVVEMYAAGALSVLPAFEGLADARGTALLVRRLDGTTTVAVVASDLQPSTLHDVHLHTLPCAYEAGGHYLLDPSALEGEENEVWLPFTSDTDGNGVAEGEVRYPTRGDAMAVVVHDPATGAKMACADLVPAEVVGSTAAGPVAPFAAAGPADQAIGGTATATVTPSGSEVTLTLTGLDPAAEYASHVHAQPCAVLDGAGHYELDPLEDLGLPENEVWLTPVPGPGGDATVTVEVPGHPLRSDAQSVVVHRVDGVDAPKVACADLVRQDYVSLVTLGTVVPLGAAAVSGTAELERRLDGVSVVAVELAGLTPGGTHPVHLHRFPCDVLEGGGHTLLDPSQPEGEGNELWVEVVANDAGMAARAVGVTAIVGADAQSVVVHAPDTTKLACVDLAH